MLALVTYPYRDRETGAVHYAGEVVELTPERFHELAVGGYVDAPAAPSSAVALAEPSAEVDDAQPEPAQTGDMSAAELRAAIEDKGGFAPKKATKAQLVEILGNL